ncbi:MAG: GNAT family N-acetyltransferase [Desulfamplus sp.]|nr:GNAT family N-acetyltransferase [Desulfamplus sp.]
MASIRIVKDPDECAFLWQTYYPVECFFDLWQVRETFSQLYDRENNFIVYEENGRVNGLLALCRITETDELAFFPGEIWNNRTWMEQNKIISKNNQIMSAMLHAVQGNAEIRYLCQESLNNVSLEMRDNCTVDQENFTVDQENFTVDQKNFTVDQENRTVDQKNQTVDQKNQTVDQKNQTVYEDNRTTDEDNRTVYEYDSANTLSVDEIGYLFYPEQYEYNYDRYLGVFAGKSRKKIMSEVNSIEKQGVSFRYDKPEDIDYLFQLNISNFGEHGYFHDPRFLNAFIRLAQNLHEKEMLRVVTVLVGNEVAAVDMGAVWNNTCTMIAGGTNKNFPGIAKLINLHHMKWACVEKISSLDFLCGDFGWKKRFHLTPRPLYKINVHQKNQNTFSR